MADRPERVRPISYGRWRPEWLKRPQVREQDLTSEFARIERAVDAGEHRPVGAGVLAAGEAGEAQPRGRGALRRAGRPDRRGRVPPGRAAAVARVARQRRADGRRAWRGSLAIVFALHVSSSLLKGLALVAAGVLWSVCSHSLAHWLVGRLVGIRFTDYFIGGPPPPRPGSEDRLRDLPAHAGRAARVDARQRRHRDEGRARSCRCCSGARPARPCGARWSLLAIGAVQIVTDLLFSVRSSDWKKVLRERAVAREVEALND